MKAEVDEEKVYTRKFPILRGRLLKVPVETVERAAALGFQSLEGGY